MGKENSFEGKVSVIQRGGFIVEFDGNIGKFLRFGGCVREAFMGESYTNLSKTAAD